MRRIPGMTKRTFVTGATGFIGRAVVRELLTAGHKVLGLVRSDASADELASMGCSPIRGSLEDLNSLRRGAEIADGVIHTAFISDFSNFAHSCAIDQHAIATIGEVLAGSNRPFVVTTGTPLASGRVVTESDVGDRSNPVSALRAPAEDIALALTERGVRSSIVRLPRSVHGVSERGWRGGLVLPLVEVAREKRVAAYVGDGTQRWPAVHVLDAARLYCLALEKAPAGLRLHAASEEGIEMRAIAALIGRRLGLPVASKTRDEALVHFGFIGALVGVDQPASSARTREIFDWRPRELGLLADLDANYLSVQGL
jgi:nucleoside-diphosphate-sugar epimerase